MSIKQWVLSGLVLSTLHSKESNIFIYSTKINTIMSSLNCK